MERSTTKLQGQREGEGLERLRRGKKPKVQGKSLPWKVLGSRSSSADIIAGHAPQRTGEREMDGERRGSRFVDCI